MGQKILAMPRINSLLTCSSILRKFLILNGCKFCDSNYKYLNTFLWNFKHKFYYKYKNIIKILKIEKILKTLKILEF